MKLSVVLQALSLVGCTVAHGYIKFVGVDNKLYPAWNTMQDDALHAKRIAFSNKQSSNGRFAVTDQLSPDITCNKQAKAPELIANARAGSNITFMWSPWLVSHKGPIVTYMARYSGDLAKTNIQDLEFFKIAERGLLPDNKTWATDELNMNHNVTYVTIPHDIKPGKYVVRHEIIAMHFSTEDSVWTRATPDPILGPQHYIQCFNIDVKGTGASDPAGVKFPGGYKRFREEPGLYFDIYWGVTPYPIPGPPIYIPKGPAPSLPLLQHEFVSFMGSVEADMKYLGGMLQETLTRDANILSLNKIRPKHGPLANMTGPQPGSVPRGSVVLGKKYYFS